MYNIEIKKENGWNVVEDENKEKKIYWKFEEKYEEELRIEVEKVDILVYEKEYKNLLKKEYEYKYKYEIVIVDIESILLAYRIIGFELGFVSEIEIDNEEEIEEIIEIEME